MPGEAEGKRKREGEEKKREGEKGKGAGEGHSWCVSLAIGATRVRRLACPALGAGGAWLRRYAAMGAPNGL